MTPNQAVTFVRRHGIVLESAAGAEPSLAEFVAGERVARHWWAHSKGREIFALTRHIRNSRAVLVCTLAGGRITYVHRRLWPAFVQLAGRFPASALDQARELHTAAGRHQRDDIAFPAWVPKTILAQATTMRSIDAERTIAPWLKRYGRA